MTIKVGDMVRIVHTDYNEPGYKVGDVQEVSVESRDYYLIGDGQFCFYHWEIEPIGHITPTILTTITDRMEQHMAAGQYVQAVKWAQVAEMVKELEDE